MAEKTLETLVDVARRRPVRRELCCQVCVLAIELQAGRLCCPKGHSFGSLAELAVSRGEPPRFLPYPSVGDGPHDTAD